MTSPLTQQGGAIARPGVIPADTGMGTAGVPFKYCLFGASIPRACVDVGLKISMNDALLHSIENSAQTRSEKWAELSTLCLLLFLVVLPDFGFPKVQIDSQYSTVCQTCLPVAPRWHSVADVR